VLVPAEGEKGSLLPGIPILIKKYWRSRRGQPSSQGPAPSAGMPSAWSSACCATGFKNQESQCPFVPVAGTLGDELLIAPRG